MPRGQKASNGDTRVAPNGYHYTKTADVWRLTHHLVAEEKLGRSLLKAERCFFIDGDKQNLEPKNIRVEVMSGGVDKKIEEIEEKIEELKIQLKNLKNSQNTRA